MVMPEETMQRKKRLIREMRIILDTLLTSFLSQKILVHHKALKGPHLPRQLIEVGMEVIKSVRLQL
jgi:hypothetical protein